MTENNKKERIQVMGKTTVLNGIYIGKQIETPAKTTFRAKYTYLQQVSEETAGEVYHSAIQEGITPDDILEITCMGYTHEQIQNMFQEGRARQVIYSILHFRIYPRK